MTIKLYITVDQSNSIGNLDGSLPWELQANIERFNNLTLGKAVLVGNNTFKTQTYIAEQGSVVLTRNKLNRKDVLVANSFDWVQAHQACLGCKAPDLWVAGGKEVFTQFLNLDLAEEIFLAQIHADSNAEVKFPVELYNWKLFMLHQQELGQTWVLVKQEFPAVKIGEPTMTFSRIAKIK